MIKKQIRQKVVCLMSGGLDSSTAAALLKETDDFEIRGVFMRLEDGEDFVLAEKRAERIARFLDIPFQVIDLKREFKKTVVDCFLKKCKSGITPNPCVVCNREIKFGLLFDRVRKMEANFVATGHYARLKEEEFIRLVKAKDREKDQSYFLWKLTQKHLRRILFPVGGYTKKEVKRIAEGFGLPVFNVPESQELCFTKSKTHEFLKEHLGLKEGPIIDKEGKVLGKHEGLWFYTIGQRKRIGLSGGPFYVFEKDARNNTLVVTENQKDLYKREAFLKEINWISGKSPQLPLKTTVKIRYRHNGAGAFLRFGEKRHKLSFYKKQKAITPGQSAVFYKGDQVLGGGIITRVK